MTPSEIRSRREMLGLTQAGLAAALGVHRDTVGGWETGAIMLTAPRSLWLDVEMAKLKRKPGRPKRRRAPGHTFIPLSGSQGPDGRYQRCGVDGCLVAPEHHRRASSTAAEGWQG